MRWTSTSPHHRPALALLACGRPAPPIISLPLLPRHRPPTVPPRGRPPPSPCSSSLPPDAPGCGGGGSSDDGRGIGGGGGGSEGPHGGPAWRRLLAMLIAASGAAGALWLGQAGAARASLGVPAYTPDDLERMTNAPSSTAEQIGAVKRLLRELFAEQHGVRGRLAALEASAEDDAAADLDLLESATLGPGGSRGSSRAAVHVAGLVEMGGAVGWQQQGQGGQQQGQQGQQQQAGGPPGAWSLQHATPPPSALLLYLHSIFGPARQHRLTAKLQPLAAAPADRLQQLLLRSELSSSLHLLLAPVGGSLQAIAPPVNEFAGAFASTSGSGSSALAGGHGLWGPAAGGTGGALTWLSGDVSASAGSFLTGAPGGKLQQQCCVQLSVSRQREFSLAAVAAHSRPTPIAYPASLAAQQQQQQQQQHSDAPAADGSASSGGSGMRTTVGLSVASTIDDGLVASAWAQKDLSPAAVASNAAAAAGGAVSWGVGLQALPGSSGPCVGLHLGRSQGGALQCEAAMRLALAPGVLLLPRQCVPPQHGAASVAGGVGTQWRF